MKRAVVTAVFAVLLSLLLHPQTVMSPDKYLGYNLGERFSLYYSVNGYFRYVASVSDNVLYQEYGTTCEGRPLGICIVSSPENLSRIEELKLANLQSAGLAEGKPEVSPVPFIWLAYNVHGSEPAGSEAAMKVLYTLVSGSYQDSGDWLKKMVIIIDPCQNPDGRDLFTTRYLRAEGYPPNNNPDAWEHNQGWPSARLNHYLFDLNRDWCWQVQPETRMRMKLYNSFMPQVHADFHEMGAESTFFLPPGADPWHEVITPWQREYHALAGKLTAALFDSQNLLYFSKENFDLFCPSFGDTWPLFNGAMGFTLEQGGGAQAGISMNRNEVDTITLTKRINGHFLASMGMIATASANSDRIMKEFYEFFRAGREKPLFEYKTVIIKGGNDAASLESVRKLLADNQISYGSPANPGKKVVAFNYKNKKNDNVTLEKNDIVISAYQSQSKLMQVMFEPESRSEDSLSYDLTAWAIPYVYNISAFATTERLAVAAYSDEKEASPASGNGTTTPYAWAVPMSGFNELKFMALLYREGVNVRYGLKQFTNEGITFPRGSVIIARGDNETYAAFDEAVARSAAACGLKPVALQGGLSGSGIDLGSSYTRINKAPAIALAGGEGTSQSFGEIWYFLERELEYPVTVIDGTDLASAELSNFDLLILPGGDYTKARDRITSFIKDGGRVVAMENAINLFRSDKTTELYRASEAADSIARKKQGRNPSDTTLLKRYEDQRRNSVSERSAGAIFRVGLDDSHPYAFGMGKEWFMMKKGNGIPFLEKGSNIGFITGTEPVAGFAGYKFREKQKNTAVISSERIGRGEVIYITDDPYFRAYWKSGRVLLGNIFLR